MWGGGRRGGVGCGVVWGGVGWRWRRRVVCGGVVVALLLLLTVEARARLSRRAPVTPRESDSGAFAPPASTARMAARRKKCEAFGKRRQLTPQIRRLMTCGQMEKAKALSIGLPRQTETVVSQSTCCCPLHSVLKVHAPST